jgi:hypothetical protein
MSLHKTALFDNLDYLNKEIAIIICKVQSNSRNISKRLSSLQLLPYVINSGISIDFNRLK